MMDYHSFIRGSNTAQSSPKNLKFSRRISESTHSMGIKNISDYSPTKLIMVGKKHIGSTQLEPRANSCMGHFNDKNHSMDLTGQLTVQDIVRSFRRSGQGSDSHFGIKGYQLPNTSMYMSRPRTTKFTKLKIPSFTD